MGRGTIAFLLASVCFGAGIACIEIGVRAIKAEEADQAWSRAAKEPATAE
jgi:hypothetical protein